MKLNFPHLIHGADYNPEQWLEYPEIFERDIELMKEAHMNSMSVGIFSWSRIEPEEGVFDFDWMHKVIDRLYENGISTILATPSGARPYWLGNKYPEVLRVRSNLVRNQMGVRHNHCYTSPVYREKVRIIDTELAKQFARHPGVILWHLSNELGGECFCPLCQAAFREWLKERYTTLDNLNRAWWTDFWSHRYTDWSQVEAPVPSGEMAVHGMNLDWKRFVTYQTVDFARWERDIVHAVNPNIPVTTNHGESYESINYFKYKDVVDIVSWDSYPLWGKNTDERLIGQHTAFAHDIIRSIKQQPFLLMESSPSATNWQDVSRLRQPGLHMLASMQALAHGSNSVQYFQWRKSRGSSEKLHGAVVDHYGKSDTRVFKEVAKLGSRLMPLDPLLDTNVKSQVAIIYDWENGWAISDSQGPRNIGVHYLETVMKHHSAFWRLNVNIDVIDMECELSSYKLVVAPMIYLLRADIAKKLIRFVQNGGIVVSTYWSGVVNETDLCWLGGMPGDGLSELFGLRCEEIDALYDGRSNSMTPINQLLPQESYRLIELCELVKCSTAKVLATYNDDFYKGMPALTQNLFGSGKAYYMAARGEQDFLDDFAEMVAKEAGITPAIDTLLPDGVTATTRVSQDGDEFIFVMNFNSNSVTLFMEEGYVNYETNEVLNGSVCLEKFEVLILKRA